MSTDEVKVESAPRAGSEAAVPAEQAPRAPGGERSSAEANAAAAKSSRPKHRRMRDMALSMAVLLVPLGLFYWAWSWLAEDRQVSVVDTSENYATAANMGLPAIEPELSDDWKPISSTFTSEGESATLRTGWYSPEGNGLQVVETTGAITEVNEELTGAGTAAESAGIDWTVYEVSSGETWVAEIEGATVLVSAEPDGIGELDDLAAAVAAAVD